MCGILSAASCQPPPTRNRSQFASLSTHCAVFSVTRGVLLFIFSVQAASLRSNPGWVMREEGEEVQDEAARVAESEKLGSI